MASHARCRGAGEPRRPSASAREVWRNADQPVAKLTVRGPPLTIPRSVVTGSAFAPSARRGPGGLFPAGAGVVGVHPTMSIAIISDVHGNLEALTAVLAEIDRREITDIVCLGDVVGYGPNPMECLDLVLSRAKVSLMGNHDFAVLYEPYN